jgi:cobalt-zinc-cadmium efflux system protein
MSGGAHGGASEQGGDGHTHRVSADPDRFWLGAALALLLAFMAVEVVVGLLSGSLALLSDAAHMLTDAGAIALALVAIRLAARPARGGYTYGLKRAEILSAQANGITLLLLTGYFGYEGVRRLVDPPPVEGMAVLVTALVGIAVNLAATRMIARANRSSLNVEGAFQHILTDLFAFIATAIAGLVMVLTGFARADALAALVVAALMAKAGYGLVRESGRVFLEAAPRGVDPQRVEADICATTGVMGVHELHIWEVTSGFPALSAHVLVGTAHDCHERRIAIERSLADRYDIHHTTLQVDHRDEPDGRPGACAGGNGGCADPPATASGNSLQRRLPQLDSNQQPCD